MLAEDFDRFQVVVRKLEGIYGKKINDATVQAWWNALRDMPFDQVRERVDSHIRFSRFFPKPADIRPKEARLVAPDPRSDASFREAEERAVRNLEELRRTNPSRWLEIMRPKCTEIGHRKGMSDGQIEAKLQRAVEAQ